MLVQPQQAATVCEFDLVQHTIRSSKRAQTLDPNPQPGSSHEPLDLTLDLEYAHVSGHYRGESIHIAGAAQGARKQDQVCSRVDAYQGRVGGMSSSQRYEQT